jgi:hypothetical protein
MNFAYEVSIFVHIGFCNMRHGADSFTSPPKKSAADFIALESPSSSAGFEPANLWCNGKKGNH